MRYLLIGLSLMGLTNPPVWAQNRVSIASTYWFNYGIYAYQVTSTYSGLGGSFAGRDIASSVGLIARYHFITKWDVSVGLLYNWNSSHLTESPGIYDSSPFRSQAIQLPVLINYRLTAYRLSPYFSAGAFLVKSKTFTTAPTKVNGLLGIGLDYRISSGLSVLVQPTASYLFYKPADDPYFHFSNYDYYGLGLQTQLIWYF